MTTRPLTRNQQYTFDRFRRTGIAGATQADAKGLVARGWIERISGKGHGMGNTPMWRLTPAGREALSAKQVRA